MVSLHTCLVLLQLVILARCEKTSVTFDVRQLYGTSNTGAIICGAWLNESKWQSARCDEKSVNSDFTYNYNPAWLPLPDGGDALLVRVQNEFPWPNPSKFALVKRVSHPDMSNPFLQFERVTENHVIFEPEGPDDIFGTEDPYLVYREKDATYYLFYTAVAEINGSWYNATLSLATCKGDPSQRACWTRRGAILPQHLIFMTKTCCGGMLFRDDAPEANPYHYLYFGEGEVLMAKTRTPLVPSSYELVVDAQNKSVPLLQPRAGFFDSEGIEGGPAPMRLSNGHYIYFYNAHGPTPAFPNTSSHAPNYHPAWAILNGSDPTEVLFRAEHSLINVTNSYEKIGLTPMCIFLDSMSRTRNSNSLDDFTLWYGAADTAVSARRVVVKLDSNVKIEV